jgi:hypothetical protein
VKPFIKIFAIAFMLASISHWVKDAPTAHNRTPAQADASADSSPCEFDAHATVVHFPQIHWPPNADQLRPEMLKKVFLSQAQIAQFIVAHPDYTVFSEAESHDLGPADYIALTKDSDSPIPEVSKRFGKTIPASLSDYHDPQIEFIARYGAPSTLFWLNQLKEIHKVITFDEAKANSAAVRAKMAELQGSPNPLADPALRKLILTDRETITVREIRNYLSQAKNKKVLLVYGGTHDFAPYFEKGFFSRMSGCGITPLP